jgi:hypothetical protein
MTLPEYWLTRPEVHVDEKASLAFDALLETTLHIGDCPTIPFTLPWPKWQFLCYLAEHHDLVLHGSGDPNITLFEPRQSNDLSAFGNQNAVYAASDGILALFFAIVNRGVIHSINNACARFEDKTRATKNSYYVFSISQSALSHQPWRTGTVYLLPQKTFTAQPSIAFGSNQVQTAQLASLEPVQPLAKLTVTPNDFPFLAQIRGHDDARLQEYAIAIQTGAAWPKG